MATQVHNWPEIKLAYMMSRHIEVQAFLKEWFGHGEGKEYKKSGIINDKTTGWRKEKENFLLNVQNEALNDYKKRLRESIEPNIKEAVEMKKASLDLGKIALKYEQENCIEVGKDGKVKILRAPSLPVIEMGYKIGKNELGEASETTRVVNISEDDEALLNEVFEANT